MSHVCLRGDGSDVLGRRARASTTFMMITQSFRHFVSRPSVRTVVATIAVLVLAGRGSEPGHVHAQCGPNPVVCENEQTAGVTDRGVWDISGAGDSTIQGFATDISVNLGDAVSFKIAA